MKSVIITIGDEILIGQTINTNAAFIGEKLSVLSIDVIRTVVIGDEQESILNEIEAAEKIADLIILTGGLGPTHDDVTKAAISKYFDSELVLNSTVLTNIQDLFDKRGRKITKINEQQAYIPEVALPIHNPRGTAPGMWINRGNKIFVSLPGVPAEMRGMIDEYVIPKIKELIPNSNINVLRKNLLTTGIPESYLFEKLGDLTELLDSAKLAFLPSKYGVKMRITVSGADSSSLSDKISEIEQKIRTRVGRFIYGKDGELLENVIARLMIDRGLTLAVAESCTGGLVSHRITNVNGSSQFFERAFVTYSNGSKVEHLSVDENYINKYGAVSIEVARQMAEGVRAVSGTDIGPAITGIMGPTGGTENKPVGT
ncbi:MAG: competence/damage-inducible protein A, partial [Melioribacteraceae bacterium]|nr:competence/damage-inducible protein A [Melioribacteraceae bacterium]